MNFKKTICIYNLWYFSTPVLYCSPNSIKVLHILKKHLFLDIVQVNIIPWILSAMERSVTLSRLSGFINQRTLLYQCT